MDHETIAIEKNKKREAKNGLGGDLSKQNKKKNYCSFEIKGS